MRYKIKIVSEKKYNKLVDSWGAKVLYKQVELNRESYLLVINCDQRDTLLLSKSVAKKILAEGVNNGGF